MRGLLVVLLAMSQSTLTMADEVFVRSHPLPRPEVHTETRRIPLRGGGHIELPEVRVAISTVTASTTLKVTGSAVHVEQSIDGSVEQPDEFQLVLKSGDFIVVASSTGEIRHVLWRDTAETVVSQGVTLTRQAGQP